MPDVHKESVQDPPDLFPFTAACLGCLLTSILALPPTAIQHTSSKGAMPHTRELKGHTHQLSVISALVRDPHSLRKQVMLELPQNSIAS